MIQTTNITKKFADFTAVDSITCNIPDGCIYGMVGSNGAGKSTFLRMITGVYKPTNGEILVDGIPVYDNPDTKSRIAYVPDDLFFLHNATITSMSGYYNNLRPHFDSNKCMKLAEKFNLDTKKPIQSFSKGMKRQVAIILALASNCDYMFFDETFDGLDPVMRNLVKSLICEEVIDRKATVIITSHSLRELEDICDQLALLHKGGLVLQNDITNLKTQKFKVQIAFNHDFDESLFNDINHTKYNKIGSVASMIATGDGETTIAKLNALNPTILDVLPLTLEEVFTYEMEALGYKFEADESEGDSYE